MGSLLSKIGPKERNILKLSITPAAMENFKEEWGFEAGNFVRIYTRYGGSSTIHEAFSLGITREEPKDIATSTTEDGINFYVEKDDIWYFKNYNLTVDYNARTEEMEFNLTEE